MIQPSSFHSFPHDKPKPIYLKKPLPSILIDFTAITLCDLIPIRRIQGGRSLPELVFFIQKITYQAQTSIQTLLVALIYLYRAKSHLSRRAVGSDDTAHRLFLAALLIASKFLKNTKWLTIPLSNRWLAEICGGLFSLEDIEQLERAFLNLVQYECWIDENDLVQFVKIHRQDFSL